MRYPGGKNSGGSYQKIICQIPPHDVYVEPFLGSGAVMRMKRPARHSIGIDKAAAAVDAFNCARSQLGMATLAVVVEIGCGIQFLESYNWTGNEFVYLDPPYLVSSRRCSRQIYLHELSEYDHLHLLEIIRKIPSPVAISGYATRLYEHELRNWRVIKWKAITRGGLKATEHLWMNYPEPVALHDYRFLGENRTERQQIKRKQERWKRRLESMPILERQALLAVMQETSFGSTVAKNNYFDDRVIVKSGITTGDHHKK